MAPLSTAERELLRNHTASVATTRRLADFGDGTPRDWQSSDDWRVKLGAGVALRRHGVKEALFVPEVVALLSSDASEVRGLAAGALAREEAPPADGDRLRSSLRHRDWRVRCGALDALLRYDPEATLGYAAIVAGLLKDPHEEVRGAVPSVLRHVGAAAAAEVAAVIRDDVAGEIQDGEDLLQALCGGDKARAKELLYGDQRSAAAPWEPGRRRGSRRLSVPDAAAGEPATARSGVTHALTEPASRPRTVSRVSAAPEEAGCSEPQGAATAPAVPGRRASRASPGLAAAGRRFSRFAAAAAPSPEREHEMPGVPADPAAQLAMDELLRHPDPVVREAAALLQQRPAGARCHSIPLADDLEKEGASQDSPRFSSEVSDTEGSLAEKDVDDLIGGLGSTSRVERLSSLRAMGDLLARMPPEAAAAHVPALVQALDDNDIEIRISAMTALGAVGQADGEYVVLIGAKLQHPNSHERAAAATAAGLLRADTLAVDLAQLLHDPDPIVRTAAEESLGRLGAEAAGEHAARWIRHENSEIRKSVRASMLHMSASDHKGRTNTLKKLQPLIEPALTDKSAEIRGEAMSLLERLGLSGVDGNLPACFLVAQALSEDGGTVDGRLDAIRRLSAMGAEAAPYAAQLGGLLGDEREQIRQAAVECARRLGAFFEGAVPVAAELLQSPLQGVRRTAVAVLDPSFMGEAAMPFQAACQVALLSDESAQVRCNAVERLTDMYSERGLEPSEVEAVLRLAATDKHWRLRLAVAKTLDRLSMELLQANMVSVSMLCVDEDWRVRRAAKGVNDKFASSGMAELHSRSAKRNSLVEHELFNPFAATTRRNNSSTELSETPLLLGDDAPHRRCISMETLR